MTPLSAILAGMGTINRGKRNKEPWVRSNALILASQAEFIKTESEKSKGKLSHGDVHRMLLEEAILSRKQK